MHDNIMNKAWHITQWNGKYERADTRKTDFMGWYAKQTKLIGFGIGKTLREPYPRNATLLGLWTLIETLASQSAVNERGWLIRGGAAMDYEDMASLLPTVPAKAFEEALAWFSQAKINWAEYVNCPHLTGTSPDLIPAAPELTGKNSRLSPAAPELTGKNSTTERQRESGQTERLQRERAELTLAAARASAPSPDEVEAWARAGDVDPLFALEKLAEGIEREDFAKVSVRKNWQTRFARFWKADKATWLKKHKKNGADFSGARVPTDQEIWWADSLPDVRSQLQGAVLGQDKKTAARLREILEIREKQNG